MDMTINSHIQDKELLGVVLKTSNKAVKFKFDDKGLIVLFVRMCELTDKIINKAVSRHAEDKKLALLTKYIRDNRSNGVYYYIASSHGDCADDHKRYQGRLYVDENCPDELKRPGIQTIQWVMDAPAYFITRPNCRHYFMAIDNKDRYKSAATLTREYGTYSAIGDRSKRYNHFRTRLNMLNSLSKVRNSDVLNKKIKKTILFVKKSNI